ncbi:hypothetical protein ONZ45_g8972 [Pleurotus djamor]|nr:hypothetical protein ONZ45_g8972 [Pleurotus djamor]
MSRGVKKPDPPHKMEFATNSLRNTTIAVEDDQYYFEVVTRFWHPTITKINRFDVNTGNLTTVAEIERLTSREPKVRFLQSSEKGTDLGEWMKASDFVKYETNRLCVGTSVFPVRT